MLGIPEEKLYIGWYPVVNYIKTQHKQMNKNKKILWWVKIRQELFTQPLYFFRNNVFFFSQTKNIKGCVYTHWLTWTKFVLAENCCDLTAPFFKEVWNGSEEIFQIQIQQKLKIQPTNHKHCCGTGNRNRRNCNFLPEQNRNRNRRNRQNRNWNRNKMESQKF